MQRGITFGQYIISPSTVFFRSKLSYGLVNLMPVVKGHVLVIPQRKVARFCELTDEEVSDLWISAKRIGSVVQTAFKAQSLTFAVQDGPHAGQTVQHVHVHILPRSQGDFKNNDDVYVEIEKKDRVRRGEAEMAEEAQWLSALFEEQYRFPKE
eukprot:TRINITY_DN2192_c0_g1_i1.p2 TRINITY_DN2192_c0_g1~~TRINITY_DN2192_c0_g1_i1.p2  ORF type:complete len:153 (-),score=21.47 TRINITY_DN2192_c0_g1_i1:79-537(-)